MELGIIASFEATRAPVYRLTVVFWAQAFPFHVDPETDTD
jgi:hypothetical protein